MADDDVTDELDVMGPIDYRSSSIPTGASLGGRRGTSLTLFTAA